MVTPKQRSQCVFDNLDTPIGTYLTELMAAKGLTAPEIYGNVVSRSYFSQLCSGKIANPSKGKLIIIGIGLRLTAEEMELFLEKAGYVLSKSIVQDVAIKHLITAGVYEPLKIEQMLEEWGVPSLYFKGEEK